MARESTESSFDELARGLAEGSISRRRALRLFASTAIAALIPSTRALAQQQKVTICHKPGTPAEKTMEVPQSAVDGHLGHGDHRGPCENETTTTTAAPTTTTTSTTSTTPMCIPNGATCPEATQCCSGTICANGKCCTPNFSPTNTGSCAADSECCSGICDSAVPGTTGSFCVDCRNVGGSCAAGELCCSGLLCENGTTCCADIGSICHDDDDCCNGQCGPTSISGLGRCEL